MEERYLRNKIDQEYGNVMSIIRMSDLIDAGNATNMVKASQGVSHLCGLVKVYAYLQLYNENFTDLRLAEIEKEVKKTLDTMQKTLVERIAELSDLEQT